MVVGSLVVQIWMSKYTIPKKKKKINNLLSKTSSRLSFQIKQNPRNLNSSLTCVVLETKLEDMRIIFGGCVFCCKVISSIEKIELISI